MMFKRCKERDIRKAYHEGFLAGRKYGFEKACDAVETAVKEYHEREKIRHKEK